jgi:periplasmic copper chaperone A
MSNHCCCLVVSAFAAVATSSASAHVTLENREATIGRSYKAVFEVPHGCAGSATTKLRVQIPQGVIAVKPMPKPGWNVEAIKGRYASVYDFHGARLSEGVKEVVWSGGKLPDDFYDEFVISAFLTDALKPNTTLYFPVVQECEQGVSRWIDIPADGDAGHTQDSLAQHGLAHVSKSPAPGVKLMPKP